ncbi:MAG: hypothetical protein CL833_08350 [Crocinitomicaceae bacterium]|nr:hypothetical protein [Crocinitomicaceae bacterium]
MEQHTALVEKKLKKIKRTQTKKFDKQVKSKYKITGRETAPQHTNRILVGAGQGKSWLAFLFYPPFFVLFFAQKSDTVYVIWQK